MVERQLISLPSQLQLLERLQHVIYLSSSFIFVSGVAGAGKSTVSEQLSNQVDDNLQQVFLNLQTDIDDASLRQQLLTQLFKQPLFDAKDRLATSISVIEAQISRVDPALIIIDHAQRLSESMIDELAELVHRQLG